MPYGRPDNIVTLARITQSGIASPARGFNRWTSAKAKHPTDSSWYAAVRPSTSLTVDIRNAFCCPDFK
jgi:hypothetical protein